MDVNQKVVFFTPKGRAMVGAPPVNPEPGRLRAVGDEGGGGSPLDGARFGAAGEPGRESRHPPQPPPAIDAVAAIPRFKRDSDIPWEVEARAWEVLDPV
jgi:hypothetical protein